jgi:hypothetical protein
VVISDSLRQASAARERAFAFLITEYGYRRDRPRFRWGGFELRYRGPVMGVRIDWSPPPGIPLPLGWSGWRMAPSRPTLSPSTRLPSCTTSTSVILTRSAASNARYRSGSFTPCRTSRRRGPWRTACAAAALTCSPVTSLGYRSWSSASGTGLAEVNTVCDRRIVRRHRVARLRLPDTMDDFGGSARR